ncbi:MAG: hypothetical protein ACI89L_001321 [Phycisphaerales bacterium]|jgi:hypothetical protein
MATPAPAQPDPSLSTSSPSTHTQPCEGVTHDASRGWLHDRYARADRRTQWHLRFGIATTLLWPLSIYVQTSVLHAPIVIWTYGMMASCGVTATAVCALFALINWNGWTGKYGRARGIASWMCGVGYSGMAYVGLGAILMYALGGSSPTGSLAVVMALVLILTLLLPPVVALVVPISLMARFGPALTRNETQSECASCGFLLDSAIRICPECGTRRQQDPV